MDGKLYRLVHVTVDIKLSNCAKSLLLCGNKTSYNCYSMPPLYGNVLKSKRIREFKHEGVSKVKIYLINHKIEVDNKQDEPYAL